MSSERGEGELLLPQEMLLSAGIHIGTRIKMRGMEPYIYKVRSDGLFILDVEKTCQRIEVAAKFLSRLNLSRVVVVSSKHYGRRPVEKFCELTGAIPITGRFTAGTFTNPYFPGYIEPVAVVVTDPIADEQPLIEAGEAGIPVVALCSTDNTVSNIDLVIPVNNKGRRSLALVYWLLCREIKRELGEIPPDGDLPVPIEEFETPI